MLAAHARAGRIESLMLSSSARGGRNGILFRPAHALGERAAGFVTRAHGVLGTLAVETLHPRGHRKKHAQL